MTEQKTNLFVIITFACIGFLFVAVAVEHGFSSNNTYYNLERFKNHYLKNTTDKTTNVLILGNSKSFRGIDTPLLNKMALESGCGLQFYNSSVPGMSSVELINNLDSVASNSNFNPDYVLFTPGVFRSKANLLSQRRRNNALARFWYVNLLSLDARNQGLRAYSNLHLSMLQRAMNKSKLSKKLFAQDADQARALVPILKAPSYYGYLSLNEDPRFGLGHRRQLKFINNPEAYELLASRLRSAMNLKSAPEIQRQLASEFGVEGVMLNGSAKKLLELYVDKIRALGAEPVAFHFPENNLYPERTYYQKRYPNMREIAAADDEIEQFINKDLWYDHEHFNKDGARLFTAIVFKQMCKG